MQIQKYFEVMVEKDSSDLYLTAARPPMYRVDGRVQASGEQALTPQDLEALASSFLSQEQWTEFQSKKEMNLALSLSSGVRFRVNVMRQRGSIGMVVRKIKVEIPPFDSLGLPPIVKNLALL